MCVGRKRSRAARHLLHHRVGREIGVFREIVLSSRENSTHIGQSAFNLQLTAVPQIFHSNLERCLRGARRDTAYAEHQFQ